IILILPPKMLSCHRRIIDRCVTLAVESDNCNVCLVSSFACHFGNQELLNAELATRNKFHQAAVRNCVVIRPGNILQGYGTNPILLRILASMYPIVSPRFKSCFVDKAELFSMIREVATDCRAKNGRIYTLLGTNRRLREVIAEQAPKTIWARCLTGMARVM